MYESLAIIYDCFTDDIDYDAWFASIDQAINKYKKIDIKDVTDLACGTGSISCRLAKAGYSVTAIDISQEMLLRAGENMRKSGVRFSTVCQDISTFMLHKPCDAIVCACDGINYLLSDEDLSGFFNSCKAALKPGGVLVFDVSSEDKLQNILGEKEYFDLRDDACMVWKNHVENRIVTMELTMFIKDENGKYTRFEEVQHQRMYSKEEIAHAARAFDIVSISSVAYDDNKMDKRLQFVCTLK